MHGQAVQTGPVHSSDSGSEPPAGVDAVLATGHVLSELDRLAADLPSLRGPVGARSTAGLS